MYYTQLRAFHAVAVHGGFSRGAEKLALTQPSVSDQVKKLEERFGVLLFNRHKRSVHLTEIGQQLLGVTRRMFEMEAEAVQLLSETRVLKQGHLRVAADAPIHVMPLIAGFRRRYPGIAVSLSVGNSREVLRRLREFEADVAVAADLPDDPVIEHVTLRSDPLVAFVPLDHPWASRSEISLHDLEQTPIIVREQGSATRRSVEEELARAGVRMANVVEMEGREAAWQAVLAGVGVGLVSAAEFSADPRLKVLQISDCSRRMVESLAWLHERARLRIIKAFVDTARGDPAPA